MPGISDSPDASRDFEELVARKDQLRSPMTLQIVEEYRAGRRFPLEVVG